MKIINFIKNKAIWIICILSFFSAFFYNELNLNQIPSKKIRDGETIKTVDDNSYLIPPLFYQKEGIWREGKKSKQAYFLRPPGYGIFYFIFLKIANYSLALKFLKITQLLLFSCSVYWFFYISTCILRNKKLALISTVIYGLSPFFIGFLYYTLTEGITPALLILFVFLLFKALHQQLPKKKIIYYVLSAFTFAYILIVRPQIGFFGIFIPLFIFYDYWKSNFKKAIVHSIILSIIAFSFFGAWEYRNYKIANEFVGLHPVYYTDNNNMFRPTLSAFWDFNKSWAVEGYIYHSYSLPFWKASIKGDTSRAQINKVLHHFPKYVIAHFGENRLIHVFEMYQKSILMQKPYYEQRLLLPKTVRDYETVVVKEFRQLTQEYKSEFWLSYHVLSPLKVFKTMAFHSNLSLYIFQHTYRGNWLMEFIRICFFALHVLCFLALILNLLIFRKKNIINYGINFTILIYVFYLCYFQRGIEERYTSPILPLLLIGLFFLYQNLRSRIINRQ